MWARPSTLKLSSLLYALEKGIDLNTYVQNWLFIFWIKLVPPSPIINWSPWSEVMYCLTIFGTPKVMCEWTMVTKPPRPRPTYHVRYRPALQGVSKKHSRSKNQTNAVIRVIKINVSSNVLREEPVTCEIKFSFFSVYSPKISSSLTCSLDFSTAAWKLFQQFLV